MGHFPQLYIFCGMRGVQGIRGKRGLDTRCEGYFPEWEFLPFWEIFAKREKDRSDRVRDGSSPQVSRTVRPFDIALGRALGAPSSSSSAVLGDVADLGHPSQAYTVKAPLRFRKAS